MQKLFIVILGFLFIQIAHADFLKAPNDMQYAFIVTLPANEGLSPQQKQLAEQANVWLQESLPVILQSLSTVLVSSEGSKDVFLNSSQKIKDVLIEKLQAVQQQLPIDYMHINAYFVAWPRSEVTNNMINTELGYPVIVIDRGDKKQLATVLAQVDSSILSTISSNYENGDRFQFAAAAFKLRLERNISIFTMQLYGALNPGEIEFVEKGDEVDIAKISIPKAEKQVSGSVPYASSALLTIRQILTSEAVPQMTLDFGTYGGIAGEIGSANGFSAQGELQIFRDNLSLDGDGDCNLKKATPTLIGVLGAKATGLSIVDEIARGRDVQFRIFEIHFNLLKHQVETMDVRMDLGQLQCLSLKSVKGKFKDKANVAIESKLNSLYRQDDLTDKLMDQLYRNETKR